MGFTTVFSPACTGDKGGTGCYSRRRLEDVYKAKRKDLMKIIHSLPFWPASAHGSVMALGNFDGVHKGHAEVIGRARAIAQAEGKPLSVMTFEPHPRRFFNPALPILRIAPFAEKARRLRELGVDFLYVARFNKAFCSLSAEEFVEAVLLEGLSVSHVVTGHNFAFGHKRSGDSAFLRQKAAERGFSYTEVDAVAAADQAVYSSTAIRHALAEGEVQAAAAILGRPYAVRGPVIHGDKRGRTIGFPTANIRPAPLFLPKFGVYAVRAVVEGVAYPAVANLGVRPTVGGEQKRLEVFLIDASLDLYGKRMEVEFIDFIRGEQKFDGIDALKAQIAADTEAAKQIHARQIHARQLIAGENQ